MMRPILDVLRGLVDVARVQVEQEAATPEEVESLSSWEWLQREMKDTSSKRVGELPPGKFHPGKFHVFKSTTLSKPANSPAAIPIYRAHAIAPGCLGAGMGKPPKVAYSNDDNYGESAKVIWLAYLTMALLDSSFVYTPRHTALR